MTALALMLGAVVGVLLGAVGGGGAVLLVPVLVLVSGEPIREATTMSLPVVALAAAAGAVLPARESRVAWRVVVSITAAAIPASYAGAVLHERLDAAWLSHGFAALLVVVAVTMWWRARAPRDCLEQPLHWGRTAVVGAVTGLLTGTFGVGGGFMIMPALVLAIGLPVRRAVGTSLAVVCLVSLAGLAAHLLRDAPLDAGQVVPLATVVLVGAGIGSRVGRRLAPSTVLRAFSALLVVAAAAMLAG